MATTIIPTDDQIKSQETIAKSRSKTFPILLFWIIILPIAIAFECIFKTSTDTSILTIIVYAAGGCTFAYMGFEYGANFFQNRQLPEGIGQVNSISKYRALVILWILYAILSLAVYYFGKMVIIPYNDIMLVAGSLSVEYVTGNKLNKIAQTV